VEPRWSGVRVLAHFADRQATFVDEDGEDCTAEFADVATALSGAAGADDLILDGWLTVQATQPGSTDPDNGVDAPSAGAMMMQMMVGSRILRASPPKHRLDPNTPIAFVAIDLLRVDGTALLDVPLLERKRLLESCVRPEGLIRVTPFVRHPIGSFVATWRGMGFDGLVYKSANSRYLPGAANNDCTSVPMPIK